MADSQRIEELKRRVQTDPASIAFAALAEEYRRAGRFEEAIATCVAGLQRHPSYLSAHVTLGRSLLEVGRYDEAHEALQYVLRVAPENLAAIRGLAEIHHRRGDDATEQYPTEVDPPPQQAEPAPPIPVSIYTPAPPSPPSTVEAAPQRAEAPRPIPVSIDPSPPPPVSAAEATAVAPPVPEMATPPDPALAGLESFLAAIVRARAARPAARQ